MSRLVKYKESLNKFIKDRSCLFDDTIISDKNIHNILINEIKNIDFTLPILLLTIMNSQNKKNHISLQGYYAASCIYFSNIILHLVENKSQIIIKHGIQTYNILLNSVILASNKSLCQNLESIKNVISIDNAIKMYTLIMNIYYESVNYNNILSDYKFDMSNKKSTLDTLKWHIKDDDSLIKEFNKIVQINRESFNNYLNKKIGSLCEMTFCIGWCIGCGDIKYVNKIKKISRYFSMLIKLANDFKNLDDDIMNHNNGVSINYVINYGLQDSYELFMYNKKKFIEECMTLDIYTNTIQEIMNFIEKDVDEIIDNTSPDMKSTMTSASSI